MESSSSKKCDYCNKTFSSKQRLKSHMESATACVRKNKIQIDPTNKFKVILKNKPTMFVGIDITNPDFYLDQIIYNQIAFELPTNLEVINFINLFKKINYLDNPNYGHPIVSLVRKAEPHDIYNYHCLGEIIQNNENDDLIRHIYRQICNCYKFKLNNIVDELDEEYQVKEYLKNTYSTELKRYVNKLLAYDKNKIKEEIDEHYGKGKFDAKFYCNNERTLSIGHFSVKDEIIQMYEPIYYQNSSLKNVKENIKKNDFTIDKAHELQRRLAILEDTREDDYVNLFKSHILTLGGLI